MSTEQAIVVEKRINIEAPRESVWPLISTPEGFLQWFMPGDIKPSEGHEFLLNTPFGNAPCKVIQAKPPEKISFTWGTLGQLSYPFWTISIELRSIGDSTEAILRHQGWTGEEDEIRTRMSGGWVKILEKLASAAMAA